MNDQSYFQLISPLIFLAFAAGFYWVYLSERAHASARMFAISYFLGALAFFSEFFRGLFTDYPLHFLPIVAFQLTAITFSCAILIHYKQRIPFKFLFSLFAISIGVSCYLSFVDNNIFKRIFVNNAIFTVIFVYPVLVMWRKEKRQIDKVVLTLLAVIALHYPIRSAGFLWLEANSLTYENYAESLTALSLQFTSAVAAIFLALALFMMYGMETIARHRQESEEDHLTGLLNRRGLDAKLPKLEAALQNGVKSHGILVLDLDHFKKVNDTYGHDVGDAVLVACGDLLSTLEINQATVVRMGGEEFAVILYNANTSKAKLIAEYVCSAFADLKHPEMDNNSATVSVGVALWEGDLSFSDAVRHADSALYHAKSQGRNRVSVSPLINDGQVPAEFDRRQSRLTV